MTEMFEYEWNGQYAPLIADDVYKVIQDNAEF
jgi:ribonucleoside-diphosphate reductase alpha chain